MIRPTALIAALITALALAGPAMAADLTCRVSGIIDGDTWRCADGTRVRLWGVNAPERHEPGGPEATRALSALIAGKTLRCATKGTNWGRVVARCYVDGQDVARVMVRRGHAVDWPKFSKGEYAR